MTARMVLETKHALFLLEVQTIGLEQRMADAAKKGFALVGAGLFGSRHAQAYSRHHAVDFVAVCDLDGARAKAVAEGYGARSYTTKLEDLLANPEIDAISVATPDNAHRAVAEACARAGKHILVEKPLAT